MAKVTILVALTILALAQGLPVKESDISVAASAGDWESVHKLLEEKFKDQLIWKPNFTNGDVRSLRPPPDGHVYAESEYSYQSSSNINGKKSESSGGHKIINNDGAVTEYDINPKL